MERVGEDLEAYKMLVREVIYGDGICNLLTMYYLCKQNNINDYGKKRRGLAVVRFCNPIQNGLCARGVGDVYEQASRE